MLLMSVDAVVQFITVIVIFIIVMALAYFTARFVGGYQKSKMAGANIQVIETSRIANNKYLQIIQVGERLFLIAISKEQVSLIGELGRNDVTIPETQGKAPMSFKEFLEKAKNLKTKK